MRVAAVQFKAPRGKKAVAIGRLAVLADRAAEDADLVVLPEMAATGYLFPSPEEAAKVAEHADGPLFQALAPLAAARGAWIVAGFAERAADAMFNSALVIDPSGALAFVYRKTLLFPPDAWWARPGDSGYRAFDTDAGRFGVGICMDLNDDAFVAWCAGERLDAVAFPTNWVDEGEDPWDWWRTRTRTWDAALVAANTYGREWVIGFSGRSAVMRRGEVLASASPTGDAVLRAAW